MKSLKQRAPAEIDLLPGVSVTVRAPNPYDFAIAQAAARERLSRLKKGHGACVDEGLSVSGLSFDLEKDDECAGLYEVFLIEELAARHVTAVHGVEVSGKAEVAAQVRWLLRLWPQDSVLPLGEVFYRKFMAAEVEMDAAKKESGDVAGGISPPAAAPNIAGDASPKGLPVPQASPA